MIRMCRR